MSYGLNVEMHKQVRFIICHIPVMWSMERIECFDLCELIPFPPSLLPGGKPVISQVYKLV